MEVKRLALIAVAAFALTVYTAFRTAAVSGGEVWIQGDPGTHGPDYYIKCFTSWEIRIGGKTEENPLVTTSTPLFQVWWSRPTNGGWPTPSGWVIAMLSIDSSKWVAGQWGTYDASGYFAYTPTNPLTDGEHKWVLEFSHGSIGNWASRSGTFRVDTSPPTVQSFQINGGAAFTNSPIVTASLSASDFSSVAEMSFSWDGIAWSSWESYQTSRSFTLPAGDGQKSIYLKLKDTIGHVSNPTLATITLDQTPPAISSFKINGGAAYTSSTSTSLAINASDATSGLDAMQFSLDGSNWSNWEPYTQAKTLDLPTGDGQKTMHLRIRDKAGNLAAKTASIILDQTPPSVGITVPQLTNSENVAIDLSSSSDTLAGIAGMKIWVEGENEPAGWESFVANKQAILPAGDGIKKISVKLRDAVGNESEIKEASVTVDKTAPAIQVLEPSGTEVIGNSLKVKAKLSDSLAGVDWSTLEVFLNGAAFENAVVENGALSFETTLPHGTYSIQLKVKDLTGNLAAKVLSVTLKSQTQPSQPSQPSQGQPSGQPSHPQQPSQQMVVAMTLPERLVNGDKLRVTIRVSNPTDVPVIKRLVLRFNGNELPLELGVQPGEELVHEATLDVPTNVVGTFTVVLADAESGATVASGNVTLGTATPSEEESILSPSSQGMSLYLAALAIAAIPLGAVAVGLARRHISRVPHSPKRVSPVTKSPRTRPNELAERTKIHRRYREHPD